MPVSGGDCPASSLPLPEHHSFKDVSAVAHVKFITAGDRHSNGPSRHLIWLQSTRRYLCSLYGYWRHLWTNGRYYSEGGISVNIPFA